MARELGLSAMFVLTAEHDANMVYFSESITEILGYEAQDVVGKSSYLIFHPDEAPFLRRMHYHAVQNEKVGCLTYMRALHQGGFFVDCAVTVATVYDMIVGIITRAINGPNVMRLASTAREVVDARAGLDSVRLQAWNPSRMPSPQTAALSVGSPDINPPWHHDWRLHSPSPRTFFLLDRFTETARIMYVSNDTVINATGCKGHTVYSIIRPQDRPRVQQWIDASKTWAPIVYDEERTGGHGYLVFDVLKIPDLPPAGKLFPQGTEESERSMPGQEFITVEGIFTASSDGILFASPLML